MPDAITGTGVDGTTNPILQDEVMIAELAGRGSEDGSDRESQFQDMIPILAAIEAKLARKIAEANVTYEADDFEFGTSGTVRLDPDTLEVVEGSFTPSEPAESDQEPGEEPVGEIDLENVDQVYGISFPKDMLPLNASSGTWEAEPILDMDGNEEAALVRVWLYPPEGRN